MSTIQRSKKIQTLHPATVRALLKKGGFHIGTWGANGRIKGMADFYGGNVEVKEYQISSNCVWSKGVMGKINILTITTKVCVEVRPFGTYLGKEVTTKKINDFLSKNGYKTKVHGGSVIVDNKKIK